ncbi:hypothetical protein [Dictyobacter arantiisoli]|uniref:Uncharacterized protein n=1 Tax=Dictyobacter arantiisoli TaxID=2014874 RepID=A0A5A5TFV9_9CHLR|nr:hypothetical protein [Dictyobacter arantiisoli]GCF09943.1 hypothetical protein KDI_35070 [Dictyobacter arantiisoli]
MFCTHCKMVREENKAPCHNCGAPSPLLKSKRIPDGGSGASWTQSPATSSTQWDDAVPQLSFDNIKPAWQTPSTGNPAATWQAPEMEQGPDVTVEQEDFPLPWWQTSTSVPPQQSFTSSMEMEAPAAVHEPLQPGKGAPYTPLPATPQQEALPPQQSFPDTGDFVQLPALYQSPAQFQADGRQPTVALQLVSEQAIQQVLPEMVQQDVVHIAPTYTTPRPLIPRKRIISGLLSVLIVMALLCTGSVYVVRATGILSVFGIGHTLSNVNANPEPGLPEPSKTQINGPAAAFIPAATTSSRYDPKTLEPPLTQQDFTTNQSVYLTYTAEPTKQDGRVIVKWYTNKQFFLQQSGPLIQVKHLKSNENRNGLFEMRFPRPAECRAELWWNNQLAKTLYFVVR